LNIYSFIFFTVGDDGVDTNDPVVARWLTQAQDGDEKAQLALGLHFFSLAESENSDGSHARLAVEWLVKASRQGSDMATERLKDCQRRNIGRILLILKLSLGIYWK
jgi:TPR repeat protein